MLMVSLYAAALAFVWGHVLMVPHRLQLHGKPWNCSVCMAGWFGFLLSVLSEFPQDAYTLLAVAGDGALAMVWMVLVKSYLKIL